MKSRKKRTNEEFIKECSIIHNNYYNYDKIEYTKMHCFITIICPIHGEFKQEANHHIRGRGCVRCSAIINNNRTRSNTDDFIKKSIKLFKDKFDYSKTKYGKNAFEKIVIICKKHGKFDIRPNTHLSKKSKGGCPICAKESIGWTKTAWRKACINKIPKLYIIKCYNNNETFYKIGITSQDTLFRRFNCKYWMPYNYKIIEIIENENSDYIFDLERKLHKINKQFKYKPLIWFDGFTECFSQYTKIN